MARHGALAMALLLSAALAGCFVEDHPLVGATAPQFTAADLKDGEFNLADHRGKNIVILDFWATWCAPCRESMPAIEGVAKDYASRGVVVYEVNQGESEDRIRSFIRGIDPDLQVLLDWDLAVGALYEAERIPQTVIIDKSGRIQAVYVGTNLRIGDDLRKDLDALLKGESLL